MPLYVADYLKDTRRLTAAEHGAYLLLIMEYWTSGELPDDDKQLARIACMSASEWKKAKPNIEGFFGAGWTHKRIDAELQRSAEISNKRAASAKQKHSKSSANAHANAELMHTQSQSQSPEEDRIGEARGSAFTPGSKALAHSLWRGLGIESPLHVPPELAGADWRAIEWERAGWTEDLVEAECRRIGPGKPLIYYEKCFASAFAKRQAPLPIVEIRQAETLTVTTHGTHHDRSANSLTASLRRDLAALEQSEGVDPALPAGAVLRISN